MSRTDLSEIAGRIIAGESISRDRLIYAVGTSLVDHTARMASFARTGDPKDLAPSEMSGSMHYTATRAKGINIETWRWRKSTYPVNDSVHNANGCANCRGEGFGSADVEKRRAMVRDCPEPLIHEKVIVETVHWREVGNLLRPALTSERLDRIGELNVIRNTYNATEDDDAPHKGIPRREWTAEQHEEWRVWNEERLKKGWAIENECRAYAAAVWEAAWGEVMLRNLKTLVAS